MIDYLILVPLAYLLGSVPFGLIAGRLVANVDVRDYGSGKIGMTNVLRTSGKTAAAVVLLLDMGKGVLAVFIARLFFDSYGAEAAAALAVLFGHNWPVFIKFRGGRGTASGWGGLLILSPIAGLYCYVHWPVSCGNNPLRIARLHNGGLPGIARPNSAGRSGVGATRI